MSDPIKFGKLGEVLVTTLLTEPFDIFAKLPTSSCPGPDQGAGPADSPASPFDDDGSCGGGPMLTS